MDKETHWYSVDYYTELDYEKKPEFFLAHGNQYPGFIPRIGETLWFHSDQVNAKRIKDEEMPTGYIVTDVCHQITQHPRNNGNTTCNDYTSTGVVIYCVPIEDYKEYITPDLVI